MTSTQDVCQLDLACQVNEFEWLSFIDSGRQVTETGGFRAWASCHAQRRHMTGVHGEFVSYAAIAALSGGVH